MARESAFQTAIMQMISVQLQCVSLECDYETGSSRLRRLEGVASLKLHAGCSNELMLSGRTTQLRPIVRLIRCLHQTLQSVGYTVCGRSAGIQHFVSSVCHHSNRRASPSNYSALPSDVSSEPIASMYDVGVMRQCSQRDVITNSPACVMSVCQLLLLSITFCSQQSVFNQRVTVDCHHSWPHLARLRLSHSDKTVGLINILSLALSYEKHRKKQTSAVNYVK